MNRKLTSSRLLWQFFLLLLVLGWGFIQTALASEPAETRVQAVLVWGTNESQPSGKNIKELDAKLRERLANIFKWRNYFEVSRKTAGVTPSKPQLVKLSDDCSVDIKLLPDNQAEVKLIGKGKTIVTRRHSLAKPDALVLAGDDKNNTAWFVVLSFN
jgi:hypothetical protein